MRAWKRTILQMLGAHAHGRRILRHGPLLLRDVEKWVQCVSDRLRAYAKQYVEQHNSMNGFSGDEPLPPNVIFEGVVRF